VAKKHLTSVRFTFRIKASRRQFPSSIPFVLFFDQIDVPDPKSNLYFKVTDEQTRNIRESDDNPNSAIEQFQAVWCGGTVQYLSEFCPDAQLKPVRIEAVFL
jgi:hypothetical protein